MVDDVAILEGLNPEQAHAVQLVDGAVCILAGAGSGKTTTITRRLAYQVTSGAFAPDSLLAVTFTRKAAGEMRTRLAALGVEGIRAMTFHAAALAQLVYFRPDVRVEVLDSKGEILYRSARALPRPHSFVPLVDLASEIDWAKSQRIGVDRYRSALGSHEPPIPEELMERVYADYERQKQRRGAMDFEDILEETIAMLERDESAAASFRNKIRAVTIDEYQDVNLVQQTLLETWLGGRSQLCAVGDDYQAIYSFTGASSRYLLGMPERYPDLEVVRLERNYRSTPEILAVANRLVPFLGGAKKTLVAERASGEAPTVKAFFDESRETAFLVDRIRHLHDAEHVAYDEMAILYRTNAASERFEDALSAASIPYQVRDGAFLERPAARGVLARLRRISSAEVAEETLRAARAEGLSDGPLERAGQQETTRQKDLAQLVDLAAEFERGEVEDAEERSVTTRDFVAHLTDRFGTTASRGVNLLTLHSAKGLEFDAVFVPALEEGELPYKRATDSSIPEERRLLYVGLTRAKRWLHVTWSIKRPSRFVDEVKAPGPPTSRADHRDEAAPQSPALVTIAARDGLAVELSGGFAGTIAHADDEGAFVMLDAGTEMFVRYGERVTSGGLSAPLGPPTTAGGDLAGALRAWRKERARADDVPAYVVMHDRTLDVIATTRPSSTQELMTIPGMGPVKCDRYGDEILRLCRPLPEGRATGG